jgi:pimeloyl-ACP methyl ester carboxylesterase
MPAAVGGHSSLPPATPVSLPGRGTAFVREAAGPPGAPALILLHGVTATAALNWFGAFGPLATHFRVVAPDLRGHGRGLPARPRFRLADCADDVAALAEVLGIDRAIVVGYSRGGLVAQLVWRRHRRLAAGLVLCSTARNFRGSPLEKNLAMSLPGFATAVRLNPLWHLVGASVLGSRLLEGVDDPALARWARAEMDRTSLATVAGAFDEVAAFTSHEWLPQLDVPAAVVVTTRDSVVPPSRQRRLAAAIPQASVHQLDGDHGVCVHAPRRFGLAVRDACHAVVAARV